MYRLPAPSKVMLRGRDRQAATTEDADAAVGHESAEAEALALTLSELLVAGEELAAPLAEALRVAESEAALALAAREGERESEAEREPVSELLELAEAAADGDAEREPLAAALRLRVAVVEPLTTGDAVLEGEAQLKGERVRETLVEAVSASEALPLAERDALPVALGKLLIAGEGDSAGTQMVRMRLLPASVTNSLPPPDIIATLCGVENSAKLPLPST